MKLTAVETTNYKSIENAGKVEIDVAATAMVGKNESGKTAWLQALRRLNPVDDAEYNPTRHYPHRRLVKYKKRHEAKPDNVVVATYELEPDDLEAVEEEFGEGVLSSHTVTVTKDYSNARTIDLKVDERRLVGNLGKVDGLDPRAKKVGHAPCRFEPGRQGL